MVSDSSSSGPSFGSLLDMAKSIVKINDTAKRNTIVVELTDKIRAAQDAQSTLIERVDDLEKELVRFETWEAEQQRYQLHDFGGGTFAYSLKEGMENGEPPHRICAKCYQDGHKSILQSGGKDIFKRDIFRCQRCEDSVHFGEPISSGRPSVNRPVDRSF